MFGQRILILVPHPDDEVVACAATLAHAQNNGSKAFALYLTHGCIARKTLWPWQRKNYTGYVKQRLEEAQHVATFLQIEPVGWSQRPARHLWQELRIVYDEIKQAVTSCNIDQIWLPAYEGGNPDHDGLNAIGQLFKPALSVIEFAEYNFLNGQATPQSFPFPNGDEQLVMLTPREQHIKKQALALYHSEKQNLNYIGVERECYRPLANYDYTKAPHPGILWYARFQWVPFRHPRVDYTDHAEVSRSIMAFLSAEQKR